MFQTFLDKVKIIRTPKTYNQYKRILNLFEDKPISTDTVLAVMQTTDLSNNTKIQYLKVWEQALQDLGKLTPDIKLMIKGLKMEEKIMPCPTEEQVTEILNRTNDDKARTIIAIMAFAGLRIGEVANIKKEDIQDNKILIRKTKNHAERYAPISKTLSVYLEMWNNSWDNINKTYDYLFISFKTKEKMTDDALKKVVKKACINAGYSQFSCHSFRRFFATMFYKLSGYNLYLTAKACGHKSIGTTVKYINADTDDVINVANKF